MKTSILKMIAPLLAGTASSAFAGSGVTEQAGSGMLIWFFIGFGVMVVLFQSAPALITFYAMLKGLFSTTPAEATFSPFKSSKNGK